MDVIALRSPSGRYLTVNDDPRQPMILRPAPLPPGAIFYRVPIGNAFTLRPFVFGGFASVAGSRMVVTPNVATEIRVHPRYHDRVALYTVSGNELVCLGEHGDGSVSWAIQAETDWTIEQLDPLIAALDSPTCCGSTPPRTPAAGDALVLSLLVAPLLDRLTELVRPAATWLVTTFSSIAVPAVAALVQAISKPAEEIAAGADPALRRLAEGYLAANQKPYDARLPMTRKVGGAEVKAESLFSAHYYDPYTQQNFLGTGPNARSECVYWFEASVGAEETGDALFKFGLATHYMSDLCRPLHAANLAPIIGEPDDGGIARDAAGNPFDWRHNTYEMLVASEEKKYRPAEVRRLGFTTVESLAHHSAVAARGIFDDCLAGIARARRASDASYWTAEETAPAMRRSAVLVQERTAELLALWVANRRIRDSFRPHFPPGRSGKWLFRADNAEEWAPGAFQHGRGTGSARIEILTYRRIRIAGTYDFMWGLDWNNGAMYVEIRDVEPATCTLEVGQQCAHGNIWGERDRGAGGNWSVSTRTVTHGLSDDHRKIVYRKGEQVVMTQELFQPAGWQPAIRFEVEFFGRTRYVAFECVI